LEPEQQSPINSGENEEKQRQDQKARYYSVKVKADKEEALTYLWAQADKARTDEAKRQALREYYDLLAKRMKKIDPSLSNWIDTMHAAYLRRLDQERVEPTIPLNLPPAVPEEASPSPEPTPSATPRKRKKRVESVEAASPTPSPTPAKKGKPSPTPKPPKRVKSAKPTPSPSPSIHKKANSSDD
jgi:hypothetical protein